MSNYVQLRVTFTQESSGLCTVRLSHKRYQDDWKEAVTLCHSAFYHHEPIEDVETAKALLRSALDQPNFP